jgi:hypothetical protein
MPYARIRLAIALPMILGCLHPGPPLLTTRIAGVDEMKQTLKREIPVGTPAADGRRFMEREGFSCSIIKHGSFSEQGTEVRGIDFLYCCRQDPSSAWVSCKWQIALVLRDDVVSDILVSSGLVGP